MRHYLIHYCFFADSVVSALNYYNNFNNEINRLYFVAGDIAKQGVDNDYSC